MARQAAVLALLVLVLAMPAAAGKANETLTVPAGTSASAKRTAATTFVYASKYSVTVSGAVVGDLGQGSTCTYDAFYAACSDQGNVPSRRSGLAIGAPGQAASGIDQFVAGTVPSYRADHKYTVFLTRLQDKRYFWAHPQGSGLPGVTYTGSFTVAIAGTGGVVSIHVAISARNKIGSRLSGSASLTQTSRNGAQTTTAGGILLHADEYFTEDEHLTLRVTGGKVITEPIGGEAGEVNLVVVVTKSDHRACRVGARGTLYVAQQDRVEQEPDEARLRICGREHDHRFVHSATYPVRVTMRVARTG